MRTHFGSHPRDLVAVVGPSIGPCCYEIQNDVVDAFATHGSRPTLVRRNGTVRLDLWTTNEQQLRAAGVPARSIESSRTCTACHTQLFFSHRAELGRTGRFALCLGVE
jgi:copper oxidase (laccase) domain-containing protein